MTADPRCEACSRLLYYTEFYYTEFDGWYCHYCDLVEDHLSW